MVIDDVPWRDNHLFGLCSGYFCRGVDGVPFKLLLFLSILFLTSRCCLHGDCGVYDTDGVGS